MINGIPSRVSYWRAFTNINPHCFQKSFREWSNSLTGSTKHIAIDGKALRGVYDPEDPNTSLILVSAWATDRGILLGQVKTDIKSNEIAAIPKLLDLIHIKDCLISIDAIDCQVDIAKKITDLGGKYLFALKGNQGQLRKDVEHFFKDLIALNREGFDYEYTERNLSSLILVISSLQIKGKESVEYRYYVSLSPMKVDEMALAIRKHWGTENGFHWSMDVGFREDRQVAQIGNLSENLAVLRRIAFNYLSQSKQEKRPLSIENKRLKAAMSTDFLEEILNI